MFILSVVSSKAKHEKLVFWTLCQTVKLILTLLRGVNLYCFKSFVCRASLTASCQCHQSDTLTPESMTHTFVWTVVTHTGFCNQMTDSDAQILHPMHVIRGFIPLCANSSSNPLQRPVQVRIYLLSLTWEHTSQLLDPIKVKRYLWTFSFTFFLYNIH